MDEPFFITDYLNDNELEALYEERYEAWEE
jgi:hypothetical protein